MWEIVHFDKMSFPGVVREGKGGSIEWTPRGGFTSELLQCSAMAVYCQSLGHGNGQGFDRALLAKLAGLCRNCHCRAVPRRIV